MGKRYIKRHQDWQSRLNKFILKRVDTPFRFGRHDCVMTCAMAINIMTGENLLKELGRYKNKEEAIKMLRKFGGLDGICEMAINLFDNFNEVTITRAFPGDIIITPNVQEPGRSLSFVALDGRNIIIPASPKGWGSLPIEKGIRAFHIP